ncbi:hypothetical protein TNCV_4716761 [Trichonephila clavipes]|nr:hypothetical protein TNCV_4716761 [Trichonephila clavipes]
MSKGTPTLLLSARARPINPIYRPTPTLQLILITTGTFDMSFGHKRAPRPSYYHERYYGLLADDKYGLQPAAQGYSSRGNSALHSSMFEGVRSLRPEEFLHGTLPDVYSSHSQAEEDRIGKTANQTPVHFSPSSNQKEPSQLLQDELFPTSTFHKATPLSTSQRKLRAVFTSSRDIMGWRLAPRNIWPATVMPFEWERPFNSRCAPLIFHNTNTSV